MEYRIYAAFVSLFAGVFILFEGVSPNPESLLDWSMVSLGAALVLGYPLLLGKRFDRWAKRSSSRLFCPLLISIGLVVIYQALTESFDPTSEILLTSLGAVLCLVSVLALIISKPARGRVWPRV